MLRNIRNLFILIVIVLLGWYAVGRIRDRSAVRQLEAKVRKQGQPLTFNDLAAGLPRIPDDQNAAVALLDLWEKENPAYWRAFRNGRPPETPLTVPQYDPDLPYLGKKHLRVAPGQQLSPASQQALETYLQTHSNRLQALRSSLKPLRYQFPIRWQDGFNALLPHVAVLKNNANAFRLEALRASQAGDVASAIQAIGDVLRIADVVAEEPLLISQLVRIACVGIALESAEDLLSRQALTLSQLDALQKLLQPLQPRKMLRLAMMGERVTALSAFDSFRRGFTNAPHPLIPRELRKGMPLYSLLGLTIADRGLILETMEQMIAIAEDTSPKAFQRAMKLDASLAARRFPPKILSALLLPATTKAAGSFIGLEARIQAATVAFAIERYRLQHGRLPDTLADLAPAFITQIPADPFDGKAFRYRPLGPGYVVYSVGRDLNDDGGGRLSKSGAPDDEAFTVNR